MQIYLVGGAVRDQLLGLPVQDRDWVVVGSTAKQMLNQGYKQVGQDFPVFLHPETAEEYALARTERKTQVGHGGFSVYADPSVTLEQDLLRRDLTINAIAQDLQGRYHDPYHGMDDIKQKVLRHISPAFQEDPLRVLRVARFAARFADLGFTIAEETQALMKSMVSSGELNELTAERVWMETEKALATSFPEVYFQVLRRCDALKLVLPELDALWARENEYGNLGKQSLSALVQVKQWSQNIAVRFATLCHAIPSLIDEPANIAEKKETFVQQLRLPNEISNLLRLSAKYYGITPHTISLSAEKILSFLEAIDVWRKEERLPQLVLIGCAVQTVRKPQSVNVDRCMAFWKTLLQQLNKIDVQEIIRAGFRHQAIHQQLNHKRLQIIEQMKNESIDDE